MESTTTTEDKLRWRQDLIQVLPACYRGLVRSAVWFGMIILVELVRLLLPTTHLGHLLRLSVLPTIWCILLVPVAISVTNEVWSSRSGIDPKSLSITRSTLGKFAVLQIGSWLLLTPLLISLTGVYLLVFSFHRPILMAIAFLVSVGSFLIFCPIMWWWTKACLAFPLVTIDKKGIVDSIRKSHELLDRHFWQTIGYIVPPFLLSSALGVPAYFASKWLTTVQAITPVNPVLLVSSLLVNCLFTVLDWSVAIWTSYPLFVLLYQFVSKPGKNS